MEPIPKKHKQEAARSAWLITYTASSDDITAQLLHKYAVMCNECYTTTWRESKYTLIHIPHAKRIRQSAMEKTLALMHVQHNIRGTSIVGFDTLISNTTDTQLEDHPGFKRIVELVNAQSDEPRIWMESGEVRTNRKGMLWRHMEERDPREKSRNQLMRQVELWAPIVRESAELKTQNEVLRTALEIKDQELAQADRIISALESRNERLLIEVKMKTEECKALTRGLIRQV